MKDLNTSALLLLVALLLPAAAGAAVTDHYDFEVAGLDYNYIDGGNAVEVTSPPLEYYSLTSVNIPNSVSTIEDVVFLACSSLNDVYCYIVDPSAISMGDYVFQQYSEDYSGRILHVSLGKAEAYQAEESWNRYFGHIVEDLMPADEMSGGRLTDDVNGDGEVNIADVNALMGIILGSVADDNTMTRAVVNRDHDINIGDINALIDIILGGYDDPGHEWVDVGLPSGTLWATCNVGATTPEGYGYYFAWGETTSKDVYDRSTYKWCDADESGWFAALTKYNTNSANGTVDRKALLDQNDDPAYVNWGRSWRVPYWEQIQELCDYCTSQWTTLNDVNGILITGPNGNTMFLPAAGSRWSSSFNDEGSSGLYWARTLYARDASLACGLGFSSSYMNWYWWNSRSLGYSVRAVRVHN